MDIYYETFYIEYGIQKVQLLHYSQEAIDLLATLQVNKKSRYEREKIISYVSIIAEMDDSVCAT